MNFRASGCLSGVPVGLCHAEADSKRELPAMMPEEGFEGGLNPAAEAKGECHAKLHTWGNASLSMNPFRFALEGDGT